MFKQVTLYNLGSSTEQEVFDFIVSEVIKQGEPAFDVINRVCLYTLYKNDKTLHCAAGMLCKGPPTSFGSGILSLTWKQLVKAERVPGFHMELISQLQHAHDSAAGLSAFSSVDKNGEPHPPIDFVTEFKQRAVDVAQSYAVDPTAVIQMVAPAPVRSV